MGKVGRGRSTPARNTDERKEQMLSEERTSTARATGARNWLLGAAAVTTLALFGGVAYAQQDGGSQANPGGQAPSAQEDRGGFGENCPGKGGGSGGQQQSQQTEV